PCPYEFLRRGLDGFDLKHAAIVEANGREEVPPHATGVEAEVTRSDVEPERGPVSEHRGAIRPLRGHREPRHRARGRTARWAVVICDDVRAEIEHPRPDEVRQ